VPGFIELRAKVKPLAHHRCVLPLDAVVDAAYAAVTGIVVQLTSTSRAMVQHGVRDLRSGVPAPEIGSDDALLRVGVQHLRQRLRAVRWHCACACRNPGHEPVGIDQIGATLRGGAWRR
jgi:hypothetical protein